MQKPVTFLLLILSIGLILGGAVSAQDVDVVVIDENDDLVEVANPGDEVAADVFVSGEEPLCEAFVEISVDPETGLEFLPDEALMTTSDLGIWISNTDPIWGGFFYYDDVSQLWIWDIGTVGEIGEGTADPTAELIAPAIVTDLGEITVYTDLWNWEGQTDPLVSSDSYTFISVEPVPPGPEPVPVAAGTVPMQTTGSPVALLMLAIFSIIGGTVYCKFR